jgi:hypothetical protein
MADAAKILLTEGDAPATPAAGIAAAYAKTDHKIYTKGSDGVEHSVAADVAADTIWDAKGDLAVGTGANTAAKLTVGDNGKYLKAASGEATGLMWDTPAGSGGVATDAIWDAKGDLAVGTGADTAAKLTIGSEDDVLMVQSGTPAWVASAVGSEIAGVVAAGAGTGNTFSRGDHVHAINHAITDNHLLTVDGTLEDNDFAYATANGIEGKTATESLTLLLANTLAENDTIKLEELLSADGKFSGIECNGVMGTNVVFGDLLYLNNDDGRWELADADAATTCSSQLAVAMESGADGDTKRILLYGYIREDDWNWATVGAPLFVHTTDGDFVEAAPSGAGDIIRVAGYVKDANSIFFNPSGVWVEKA